MGDHSASASVERVRFMDCVEDNFFTQYVNTPTRGGNILDLVLHNEPDLIGNLEVIDCLANSDHNMISWTVYFETAQGGGDREVLDFRRTDFELMRELKAVCWDELLLGRAVPDHEFTGFRIPDINRIGNSRSGRIRIPDSDIPI